MFLLTTRQSTCFFLNFTPFLHDGFSHYVLLVSGSHFRCLFQLRGTGYLVYLGDDFWKILRIQLGAWFAAYTCSAPVYGGFEEVHTYSTLSGGARVGVRIRRRGQICASSSLLVLVCSLPYVTGDDFIDLSSLVSGSHLSGVLPRSWSTGKLERRGDGFRSSAWFNSGYAHASVYGEFGWM